MPYRSPGAELNTHPASAGTPSTRWSDDQRRVVRRAAAVGLLATGLTAIIAAPVILNPTTLIFGQPIVGAHHDPFTVMAQFQGRPVVGLYVQPLTDWFGRLLGLLMSPVAAYNVVVLTSFPLAAVSGYLLAFHVTGSHAGSLVAALLFAFSPFHLAHAAYHAHIAQIHWLPLYLLALWRCLDRPTSGRLALLIGSTVAVVLASFYLGFVAAVMSPAFVIAYWLAAPRHPSRRPTPGLIAVATTLAVLGVVAALAVETLYVRTGFAKVDTTVLREELFAYSARWWSYLVPPVDHPIWGGWARSVWDAHGVGHGLLEQQVFLGWFALALGAVPLWAWVRGDRTSPGARAAPLLVAIAAVALVCSMSPERQIGPVRFVRPSSVLYELAPMFRAYARFGVVVNLMVAILAGAGAARLLANRSRLVATMTVMLIGLALTELAPVPPWRSRDVLPTQAHRWVAGLETSRRVLECASTATARGRWSLWLMPQEFMFLGWIVEDCGEPGLGHKLAGLDVGHVIASPTTRVGRWLSRDSSSGGLTLVKAFPDGLVFETPTTRPALFVGELRGFEPRDYGRDRTWRWMDARADLRVVNTTDQPVTATLGLELMPAGLDPRLQVTLDGRDVAAIDLSPGFRVHDMGPLTFPPGSHLLGLSVAPGPGVDASDRRTASAGRTLALGNWRWTIEERR